MRILIRTATCVLLVSGAALLPACGTDAATPSGTDRDAALDPDGGDVAAGGAGQGGTAGSGASRGSGGKGTAGKSGAGGGAAGGGGTAGRGGAKGDSGGLYTGPSVGTAKQFAALAYDAVTTANVSTVTGSIGVSAAAKSTITGFDGPSYATYGNDSLAPDAALTGLAQGDVTVLVGNIDPRACDTDLTDVVGGLTGDITLHPGVTCMNSFSADILVNGHVTLDAGGDPNAFFIVRGNKAMTVADGAQVVLSNGARACGVFWRIAKAVTIGKTVAFEGTVIAGTAITMKSGSTLNGRALAQTEGVHLDANTLRAPSDADCPHVQ